jgi:hypothetical protein
MFNQKSVKWSFLIASVLILAACGEVGPSPSLSSSSSISQSSEVNDERHQIYLLALNAGFTGTYEEWLTSIKGADGTALLSGTTNPTSSEGKNGDTFVNTVTWDVFVKSGGNWTNVGNIMGPKGEQGESGQNGLTPYIGENGNWWIGDEDTGVYAGNQDAIPQTGEFQYAVNSDGQSYVLTKYTGKDRFVRVPERYNGYIIKIIGNRAFQNNNILENITLSNYVTKIEAYAFSGAVSLKSINLSNSIDTIEEFAFERTALTSIDLPETLNFIGQSAFRTSQLASVSIPEGVTAVSDYVFKDVPLKSVNLPITLNSIGVSAFENTQITFISIPNGVTSISDNVFKNTPLSNVNLPNNLTLIGISAFENTKLNSIILPDSLVTLSSSSFAGSELTSIVIPDNVTTIGANAFMYNPLTSVILSKSIEVINSYTFSQTLLTSIDIPSNVTRIGDRAFSSVPLERINLPSTLERIGSYSFTGTNMDYVIIPSNVNSIGKGAFQSSKSSFVIYFQSIVISQSWNNSYLGAERVLTGYLSKGVFEGLNYEAHIMDNSEMITIISSQNLEETILPSSINGYPVKKIAEKAFFDTNLRNVEFSNSISHIGSGAFGKTKLETIFIPNSVTTIGPNAFSNDNGPIAIYVEAETKPANWSASWSGANSVVWGYVRNGSIGEINYAIGSLNGATTVTITPSTISTDSLEIPRLIEGFGVTKIGDYAFKGSLFTSVTLPDSILTIGSGAFSQSQITTINIPNSVVTINAYAFFSAPLVSVVIGNGVTKIESYAFAYNNISSITIPYNVVEIGEYAFINATNSILTINVRSQSKPLGWNVSWYPNWNSNVFVVWGYRGE